MKNDNISAFRSYEYDKKIRQTMPYYEEFYRQVIELVKTVFTKPVSWLDLGCGTGMMGKAAYDNLELEKFLFTDVSQAMLDIVKERFRYPNASFSVCDIREFQADEEFDIVTAIQSFHFLQEKERREAIRHCHAALKEGGLLIYFENFAPFTETGIRISLEKWERFQLEQGKSPEECRSHIERYGKDYFPITIEEHLRLMRDCGFQTAEVLWVSNMQAGFWAMK